MKSKIWLTVITMTVFSVCVNAQHLVRVPFFQFGIKAGANLTRIGDESFKDEYNYGYHFGGFAVLKLSKAFQLQPEVLFNQFKTRTSHDFGDITDPNNLRGLSLNYLSIPLLLNITPSKLLAFEIGPQYGILMNSSDHLVDKGKEAFKKGDLSMLGGLQLSILHFKFSARYMIGLTDISDLPTKKDWKNQGWQLGIGYRIL